MAKRTSKEKRDYYENKIKVKRYEQIIMLHRIGIDTSSMSSYGIKGVTEEELKEAVQYNKQYRNKMFKPEEIKTVPHSFVPPDVSFGWEPPVQKVSNTIRGMLILTDDKDIVGKRKSN